MLNKNEDVLSSRTLLGLLLLFFFTIKSINAIPELPSDTFKNSYLATKEFRIKDIVFCGNIATKTDALRSAIPYKVGDIFDASLSAQALNNLERMDYFNCIKLEAETDDGDITLYFIVEERPLLEGITFTGNSALDAKKIKEDLEFDKIPTIDQDYADFLAKKITQLYHNDSHHNVIVTALVTKNPSYSTKASVEFTVAEGKKSSVRRIHFSGNTKFPSRKLCKITLTQERNLLGITGNDGLYVKQMLEEDKRRIRQYYQEFGYLLAKAYHTEVKFSADLKDIDITYFIDEGPQFTIESIEAPADDIFTEEETKPLLLLEPGDIFSIRKLHKTLERFRDLWGQAGYISADITEQTIPNTETNTVSIKFNVNHDKQLYVNRILITGNNITRDKVIRRQLAIEEGDLITTQKMDFSKKLVEQLSFFKDESVDWKMHRITDELADLEMNVTEQKTGNLNFQLSYGNDQNSTRQELRGSVTVDKNNIFGLGLDAGAMVEGTPTYLKKIEFRAFDPYFLDSNVSAGAMAYRRVNLYDQWKADNITGNKFPEQTVTGANIRTGFRVPSFDRQVQITTDFGIENIHNANKPTQKNEPLSIEKKQADQYTRRLFQEGTLSWLGVDLSKDTRNHQVYPNSGYKVVLSTKIAPPTVNKSLSFFKIEAQASCYTPIIGRDTLVLGIQSKLSFINGLKNDAPIPYKELFHIGGQTTVRGFTWGGVGPAWKSNDNPLGARKAAIMNAELIFPILQDYGLKAHLFYDTGAGWDAPLTDDINRSFVKRNSFSLRHAVGFGLNISSPMPAKIDWGFKLDRRPDESPSEFHISMNYAW